MPLTVFLTMHLLLAISSIYLILFVSTVHSRQIAESIQNIKKSRRIIKEESKTGI